METKKTVNILLSFIFVVLFSAIGKAEEAAPSDTGEASHVEQAREISSTAEESKKPKEIFYKCMKSREMRWMRIYYQKNGKCKTVYSKTGNAQEVAQGYSYTSCEDILNGIKKNLESGGFSCEEKILMGALNLE